MKSDRHIPVLIGCELERVGHQMGDIFASAALNFRSPQGLKTETMHKAVSTLRKENPDLFLRRQVSRGEFRRRKAFTPEPEHIDLLFECLESAETKDYKKLQCTIAGHIIDGIFYLVSQGSMDYDKGSDHLAYLDKELRDIFYPEGYIPDDDDFENLTDRLNRNCSESFRTACAKYLFSGENFDQHNEYVIKAQDACLRRPKRKSEECN
ncbi:hypothetical protein MP638_000913 [Amoeboaphelidium occidentale]|nr:hypothetical protein MP638_000913 [Amoeboaphelidium occidentale]